MSLLQRDRQRHPAPPATRHGWLHVCNGLVPSRDGGMVPSILGFTGALAGLGAAVHIVTPTASDLDAIRIPHGVTLDGPVAHLAPALRQASLAHLHGLWQTQTRQGAAIARRSRLPHIITAHGMADPWALRQKALKKRIYTALVEGKNLQRADCLHALSRPEIQHYRALAPHTPIALVPNGVDVRPFDVLPDRSLLEAEYPALRDRFVLLFYGRLHAKKGLDLLAETLPALIRDGHPLHLLLAGRDDGAWEPFRLRMAAVNMEQHITYVGHVGGEMSRRVWAAADAFVLPSYSEGFSMAVLEALACRLPALITTTCYFPEAARAGAAVEVEPSAAGVRSGLLQLLERSPAERTQMGRNGRDLVERSYTWHQQAQKLAEVYAWMLRGGPSPRAIHEAESAAETTP